MAKNNNLTDLLTDVANAIREKKGTSDPINPQNFSDEIASIETGGSGGSGGEGDVIFRDYDGKILHMFSASEFLAMSAMPEVPTQQGLICQEWNWTFSDAQSYVQEHGKLEIGASYITDDGKTRYYVSIAQNGASFPLSYTIQYDNSLIVDWGDGNIEEPTEKNGTIQHTYENVGNYVISLTVAEGANLKLGFNSTSGSAQLFQNKECFMLRRVELGEDVILNYSAFKDCYSLKSVVLPTNSKFTGIFHYAFKNCNSLKHITIPKGITNIYQNAFLSCVSLESISLPNSLASFANNVFQYCSQLKLLTVPNSVTSVGTYAFQYVASLRDIALSNKITSIGDYAFSYCSNISKIKIPQNVTNIQSYVFYGCRFVTLYDFRSHANVPKLSSSSCFSDMRGDCKIVVPDILYDDWIAASNWASYASHIVKASEYTD
jgi:hypothetical protein